MGLPAAPPPGQLMLPSDTYADSVVLVTGAGTGLGKGIAVEFARLGASIVVAQRNAEHRAVGIEAVEAVGGKAIGVALDVRHADQVAAAFDQAEAELGPVDVLVNNAAGNFPVLSEDLSLNGWRAVTGIVLDGTFAMSSEFARRRIALEASGVILNIGATYAWTGGPGTAASAAAKAGVSNLTMSLAVEWAPHGIRINTLAPGQFPHDDHPAAMQASRPRDLELQAHTIPAGRVGLVHELGYAATYMCSPYANYLTGHTLVLDGANWLRRNLAMPEFIPVSEQAGFTKAQPK